MMKLSNFLITVCFLLALVLGVCKDSISQKIRTGNYEISKAKLKDKVKGGWAGQTIGVTFGSYTEFRHLGTFIPDNEVIPWSRDRIKNIMTSWTGLYDDIYMDLTFVEVFERLGLDAPVDSFANAFANAGYMLWHANQAARYNILNGIKAPASGHWLNNPHADDIDYQIESDFAGLMSPGMPNAASGISDKIGHIMNYGDGWYGGVYMGAMYALAFTNNDIQLIVRKALDVIPKKSKFHQCIADVIAWHRQYPNDWKQTWFEIQRKWGAAEMCPDGVFSPFNIDVKVNAAYVVLGLLYGNGDFGLTMEISTRAGNDSDCNPSTAAGILGTMLGYENIPDYWTDAVELAKDLKFDHTNLTLEQVYEVGYKHALGMIERHGGKIKDSTVVIALQVPKPVRYEQGFEGLYPVLRQGIGRIITDEISFEIEGTGLVLEGSAHRENTQIPDDHVFELDCFIDGKKVELVKMPVADRTRRHDIFWKYQLPKGKHLVRVVVKNPKKGYYVRATDCIIYSDTPVVGIDAHRH